MIASPTQLIPETAENQSNSRPSEAPTPTDPSGLSTQSSAPSTPPPPSRLLTAFRALKFDPIALANQQNLSSEELLDFIKSPAVQDHLAAVRAFAEDAFAIRTITARNNALNHLEEIAASTPDPIEKRRAATAILRGLIGNPPHRSGSRSPSSPQGGGAALRGGGGSNSTSSTNSPFTHDLTNRDALSLSSSRGAATVTCPGREPWAPAPNSEAPKGRQSPSPREALPLATPSPSISAPALANLTLSLLRKPRDPHSIATLRAFCMPEARLAGIPIPTDDLSFARRAIDILLNADSVSVCGASAIPAGESATCARFLLTTKHIGAPDRTLSLELRRGPDSWLIAALNPGLNNFPEDPP